MSVQYNHVILDRLKNSIKQLKRQSLESIAPEEFHLVKKSHENLYKKSFKLTKERQIRKFNELISKNEKTHLKTDLLAKGLKL